jgi:hypothetical protein
MHAYLLLDIYFNWITSSMLLSGSLSSSMDLLLTFSLNCSFKKPVVLSHDCYWKKFIMHAYFYLDIYIQFITSSMLLSSSLTLSLDWESTVSLDYIFKRMLTSVLFNLYYSFITYVVSPSYPIP